jgi:hypothetical protein
MQLLKACNKGRMNGWESFYMQILQQNLLIDEQKTNEPNPLGYTLWPKQHVTQPDTHSDSVHARPAQQQHQQMGKSIIEYIKHIHNIISTHPHNNAHIYCRSYMQPQIHNG